MVTIIFMRFTNTTPLHGGCAKSKKAKITVILRVTAPSRQISIFRNLLVIFKLSELFVGKICSKSYKKLDRLGHPARQIFEIGKL